MTLIIGALNRRYAIQVSDRRTTSIHGVESEQVTKALIFTCNDGRFAIGYSGLAEAGTFKTRYWLIEALKQCGPADFSARMIVWRLAEMLSNDFVRIPQITRLPPRDRRLTLMFTGFVSFPNGPAPSTVFVSNFQDFQQRIDYREPWPRFQIHGILAEPGAGVVADVQRIGAYSEIGPNQWRPLLTMLSEDRPPEALVGKMVQLIREAAKRLSSGGAIGQHALSAVIPSDFAAGTVSGFYSATASHTVYMADNVVVTDGFIGSAADIRFAAADPANTPPLVVPIQPRNRICGCGSGKKYKHCHGR